MNRSIRFVSLVVGIMFAALFINITASYVVRTPDLLEDPRNTRVRDEQFGGSRGPILAANTPIAENTETGTQPYAYQRSYLNGPLYAPVTGYYSYIYGRTGIEAAYNSELTGQADSQFAGRLLDIATGKQTEGGLIQTTIQPQLQQAAWDTLGDRRGAVAAIDYSTGKVLAWVTKPSYDPGVLASLDFGATQAAWDGLLADESRPMSDRAAGEIYPPGSTFKMVVAAAALEAGMTPETMIDTPAELPLPQSTMTLPNESACGNDQRSLDEAFTLSCNTSFANIGMELGQDAVREQAEKFGFDTDIAQDFSAAQSTFPADLDAAQLAMSSIGQFEVAASPLQMASIAGTIANGGTMMSPYVVSEVRDANQTVVSSRSPHEASQAMSAENAATLSELMRHVVERGTGTSARVSGMTIGGKTGTAETESGRTPYSWFAGYSSDTKVALAVFLEDPQGQVAAAVAGQIFGTMQ